MQKQMTRTTRTIAVAVMIAFLVACATLVLPGGNTAFADLAAAEADSGGSAQTTTDTEAGSSSSSQTSGVPKASVVKDGLYTIESLRCSDAFLSVKKESTKAGAVVVLADGDDSSWSQKWLVVQDERSGYYTIRNLASRMFLGIAGSAKSGASLKQVKKASTKKQLWKAVSRTGGVQFCSVAAPKLALSAAGKASAPKLRLKPARNAKAQKFMLAKTDALTDGQSYFIRSAAASAKALAVKGASSKNKAKIVLQKASEAKYQKFRLLKVGKAWRMQCVKSCKYVSAANKALRQVARKFGKARKWSIELDLGTGAFTIRSVAKGTYVDATSGKLALKAQSEAAAQRFVLEPTYGFTVFLDAGHGKNAAGWGVYDPGAPGSGYEEADLTKDLTARIEAALEGSDVRVFNGTDYSVPYSQRNAKAKSLGCDVLLSVHFDAGGGTSTSTMVGTHGASGSSVFNAIIHPRLVSSVGLRDGGTTHRSDITVVNGSVPAVLMEVCFIDNSSSLHTYLSRRSAVAASLAEGIIEAEGKPALQ